VFRDDGGGEAFECDLEADFLRQQKDGLDFHSVLLSWCKSYSFSIIAYLCYILVSTKIFPSYPSTTKMMNFEPEETTTER